MLFSTLVLTALASSAMAADYRSLVSKPNCTTMEQFQANFEGLCPNFKLATDKGYKARTTYFYPGDFQGKEPGTKAKAFCTYDNPADGTVVAVTADLVHQLGGEIVQT